MGYLFRISFLGYVLKSYSDYQKISYYILSYPVISFHILSYPIISSGANSQMLGALLSVPEYALSTMKIPEVCPSGSTLPLAKKT